MQVITNDEGYVASFATIGSIDGGIEIDVDDIAHFEPHYEAYKVENGNLIFDADKDAELALDKQKDEIRRQRETECFSIINRGEMWYSRLTNKQKIELEEWYQAWLDAPETLEVPEAPSWI